MFRPRTPRAQADQHLTDDLLSAYLDGQVTAGERVRVEAHLAECPACAGELRALQATADLLRELPPALLPRAFTIPAAAAARRTRGHALWDTFSRGWGYRTLQGATVLAMVLLMALCSGDLLLQTVPALAPAALAPAAVPTPADRELLAYQPSPTQARGAGEAETPATGPAFQRVEPTQPPVLTSPPAPAPRQVTPDAATPAGKAVSATETPILAVGAGALPETPTPVPPAPWAAVSSPTPAPEAAATPTEETTTDAGTTPSPASTAVVLAQPSPVPLLEAEPASVAGPSLSLMRLVVCGAEVALLAVVIGLALSTGAVWLARRHRIDE